MLTWLLRACTLQCSSSTLTHSGKGEIMSTYSNDSCRNLPPGKAESVFYGRLGVCCVTFVACLVSLVVICVNVCWRRVWNTFVHRLKLQLTAVALVLSVLYILQILPIKLDSQSSEDEKWDKACKSIAFLLTYGDWVLLLIILWLVVYLCRLAWKIGQPVTDQRVYYHQRLFELLGTAAAFTIPLLFVWIPFADGYYGEDQKRWCAIVIVKGVTCSNSDIDGIGYVMGIWYLPAILVTLAATVGIIIAITLFWRHYKRQGLAQDMRQAILKGIAPVTYLVLFNIVNIIDCTNLIYHNVTKQDNWDENVDYGLQLVHTLTGPVRAMAIPFGFIMTQFFTECCIPEKRNTYNQLN